MMKAVMNTRVAALALAATALTTAPALADHGKRSGVTVSVSTNGGVSVHKTRYNDRYYGRDYRHDYRRDVNEYGQTRQEVRRLKRTAIRACRRAIRSEADYLGFYDVDFDNGRRAWQIGPRGFEVRFNEVEFENRRGEIERPVTCIVRRGDRVKQIHGIPRGGKRGYRNHRHNW
jgi:hypothetical protein